MEKTTLNWDKGPYLVYLHAVDIINQLHVHLAQLLKNRNNTSSKKKEENNFTQNKKPVRFKPRFIGLTTDIYVRPLVD